MGRCCFRPRRFPLIIWPFSLIFLFFVGKGYCRSGQRTKDFSCASSLPPGHELCAQGLCFDLFRTDTEQIVSGCAGSSDLCAVSGCSLLADRQAFVCCCAHSFCNAKSSALVRARWRMFQKGDYPLGVEGGRWRKSARNLANERGQGEKGREQSLNSTTKILIMTTTNKPKTTTWSSTFRKTDEGVGGMKEESAEGKTKAMSRTGEENKNVESKGEGERWVDQRMDVAKTREREEHEKEQEKRTNEEEKKRKEKEEKRTNEEETKRKEKDEKRTNEEEKKRKEKEEKRTNEEETKRKEKEEKRTNEEETKRKEKEEKRPNDEETKRKEKEEKRTNEEEKKRKEKEEKRTNEEETKRKEKEEKRPNEEEKTLTKMHSPQSSIINKSSSPPTATSFSPLTILPATTLFAPKAANNGQEHCLDFNNANNENKSAIEEHCLDFNNANNENKNAIEEHCLDFNDAVVILKNNAIILDIFSITIFLNFFFIFPEFFTNNVIFALPHKSIVLNTINDHNRIRGSQKKKDGFVERNCPFTVSSSTNRSDRTTRSPEAVEEKGGQSPTDERQRKAQRTAEDAVSAFPWYWVALAGFVCSSAVFSLVYLTFRGCRRIFNKRRNNSRESIGEAAATNGEAPIMMANGGKAAGWNRKRRVTKEGKRGAKEGLAVKGKTATNDSLMSHCTTSTAVTTSTNEKNGSSGFEGGEQMTVLDPLLNQEWSGTLCK
uniref:Uncharacterized protein n=1 Tax=Globodera rostochiensis TaxID=31243 RepID=A0A914HW66_GLORO